MLHDLNISIAEEKELQGVLLRLEKEQGITLDELQREAVPRLPSSVSVLSVPALSTVPFTSSSLWIVRASYPERTLLWIIKAWTSFFWKEGMSM